jgi:abscisic acid receptor (PYR/PYL family)
MAQGSMKGRQDFQAMLESKQDLICRYHTHELEAHQCGSILLQQIDVPVETVWSVVRRFDKPEAYKQFIQACQIVEGDGGVGSVRELHLVTSVPATTSLERLDVLDDQEHIISFRVLGGGHRLQNYWSVTSLHEHEIDGKAGTLVFESYVVDIPDGNTREETHMFIDTVVRCNLRALSRVSQQQKSKAAALLPPQQDSSSSISQTHQDKEHQLNDH